MANLAVVLDTNVLLSGLAFPGGTPGRIIGAWRHGALDVILSPFILDELRRVLPRLAHRHGLSAAESDDLVDGLYFLANVVDPAPIDAEFVGLRDAMDLPVLGTLATALSQSSATYLTTGDQDLLSLADRWPIVTPAEFWAKHGGP